LVALRSADLPSALGTRSTLRLPAVQCGRSGREHARDPYLEHDPSREPRPASAWAFASSEFVKRFRQSVVSLRTRSGIARSVIRKDPDLGSQLFPAWRDGPHGSRRTRSQRVAVRCERHARARAAPTVQVAGHQPTLMSPFRQDATVTHSGMPSSRANYRGRRTGSLVADRGRMISTAELPQLLAP